MRLPAEPTGRPILVSLHIVRQRKQQPMDVAIIPKMLLDRLEIDPGRRLHLNVLLSALLLFTVAALLVRYADALALLPHVCLAHALFGIPCPGCGVTRSALALLVGDVGRAWSLNPAGPVLCAAVAFQVPLRFLALCGACGGRSVGIVSRAMTIVVLVVLIVNWLVRIQ